jgi:hypothetical protein
MIVDRELTPLGRNLRRMHKALIESAETPTQLKAAISTAYWINRYYPVDDLMLAAEIDRLSDFLAWIGSPTFEHLCPRCAHQHEFTMVKRGYVRAEHLCPQCQNQKGVPNGG